MPDYESVSAVSDASESGNGLISGAGFGVDLGVIIYRLNSYWNAGLNITNIYNSGINYKSKKYIPEEISPELNIGVFYYHERFYYWVSKYWETNDRLAFAFDLTDLPNHGESFFKTPFKKSRSGVEYEYNPFVIRVGFNSERSTIGGVIGTNVIQLEYAFYGEERGMCTLDKILIGFIWRSFQ